MARPVDAGDVPWRPARGGPAFVYVFPCSGEAILKLGFSRDPLNRLQTLHQRYFEFFDLDSAILIETETVKDARAIELSWRRIYAVYNAPAPLVVSPNAGGATEWYRGALADLGAAASRLEMDGYTVHRDVRSWLRIQLQGRLGLLFYWCTQMVEAIESLGPTQFEQRRDLALTLRNSLDAFCALEVDTARAMPPNVSDWLDYANS